MDLKLSWDLFVIVFFAIVTAYSFIIGRQDTLKIIIGTYIATLTADGLGNVFQSLIGNSSFFEKLVKFIGYGGGVSNFSSILKILFFITIIVLLTIYGDFEVKEIVARRGSVNLMVLFFLSILSCGLILSTIIVFANGGSLIGGVTEISDSFKEVYEQSRFVKGLLDWHDLWFSLPGLALVMFSLFQKNP